MVEPPARSEPHRLSRLVGDAAPDPSRLAHLVSAEPPLLLLFPQCRRLRPLRQVTHAGPEPVSDRRLPIPRPVPRLLEPPQHADQLHRVGEAERSRPLPQLPNSDLDLVLRGEPIRLHQPHRLADQIVPLDGGHLRGAAHLLDDLHEQVELGDQVAVEQGGDAVEQGGDAVVVWIGVRVEGGEEEGGGDEELEEAAVPSDTGGEGERGCGGAEGEGGEGEWVAARGGVAEEGDGELVTEDERAASEDVVEGEEALDGDGGVAGGAEAVGEGAGGGRGGDTGAVAEGEDRADVAEAGGLVGGLVRRGAKYSHLGSGRRGEGGSGGGGERGGVLERADEAAELATHLSLSMRLSVTLCVHYDRVQVYKEC